MSVSSKIFPVGCVRLGLGWMTWKSAGASLDGSERISGQLPEPESSTVHVIGSPAFTCTGTIFDVILKSPTAPLNPLGAGGRGPHLERDRGPGHGELLVLWLLEEAESGDAHAPG